MRDIYISVNIEASGPVPAAYSMLALGACLVHDVTSTFYTEFKPISENADPEAMKIVGRSLKDFESSGREPKEAMIAFRDWIDTVAAGYHPVFAGFNATFDWAFVNFYFHQYLHANPFGFGGVDIKSYYMGMTGSDWKDARSSRIPQSFKGVFPHTHNALDDAVEQAEMFRRMKEHATDESHR